MAAVLTTMTLDEARAIARRQVEENTAKVVESVKRHCRKITHRVKTPFMFYREMRAKQIMARGGKPDWKAIGHEWKHDAPQELKNRLIGEYMDSILASANAMMNSPCLAHYLVMVTPSGIQGKNSFKLVKVEREEVNHEEVFKGACVRVGDEKIYIYRPNYECDWWGHTRSRTFTPIILYSPVDRSYWAIRLTQKVSEMCDSCDARNFLSIYNGIRSRTFHGSLTAENVYYWK